MMNDVDQLRYETAIIERESVIALSRPFVLYKPRLFPDGNQWCALLGEDLQSGVVGFGDSPNDASNAFDKAWFKSLQEKDDEV